MMTKVHTTNKNSLIHRKQKRLRERKTFYYSSAVGGFSAAVAENTEVNICALKSQNTYDIINGNECDDYHMRPRMLGSVWLASDGDFYGF